jgi:hypothetical protein
MRSAARPERRRQLRSSRPYRQFTLDGVAVSRLAVLRDGGSLNRARARAIPPARALAGGGPPARGQDCVSEPHRTSFSPQGGLPSWREPTPLLPEPRSAGAPSRCHTSLRPDNDASYGNSVTPLSVRSCSITTGRPERGATSRQTQRSSPSAPPSIAATTPPHSVEDHTRRVRARTRQCVRDNTPARRAGSAAQSGVHHLRVRTTSVGRTLRWEVIRARHWR